MRIAGSLKVPTGLNGGIEWMETRGAPRALEADRGRKSKTPGRRGPPGAERQD